MKSDEAGMSPQDVLNEADRRIRLARLKEARRCGLAGPKLVGKAQERPSTTALRDLTMQIEYVAKAMIRLDKIPPDFREDYYWPG
jgi:hypothetical protein